MAFKSCSNGVSGNIEGGIESILAECNSILESFFDSGPCFLNGALEFVKVRLRMFFDGNLFYYLLMGRMMAVARAVMIRMVEINFILTFVE
jgi:hypothetical protein